MELYGRFMITLAFGLLGLGLVMRVLLDEIFNDWDAVADAQAGFKRLMKGSVIRHGRHEDHVLDMEGDKLRQLSTRLVETKRAELQELEVVEHKLHKANLIPVSAAPVSAASAAASAVASGRNPVYDEDWG